MTNRIRQLANLGQAIWLDFIDRRLLTSGGLDALIAEGLLGMTSNPTIFQKAISGSRDYDDDIRRLATGGKSAQEIYESLAMADIAAAAVKLQPVWRETHGRDGYVSIEVSPTLAHDTDGTIAEARRLWGALKQQNVMIKVPATEAGLPAIATLIGDGINVNVTLIFAISMYERVVNAYIRGLEQFRTTGKPLWSVSSVASFFVSRVDSVIDKLLGDRIQNGETELEWLMGRAAIANAKIAYAHYKAVFEGQPFEALRSAGARAQRPLWASTSTKNPNYPDTMYVDPLIGVNTVNTVPPQTLDAIRDHAVTAQTIERDMDHAWEAMNRLKTAGIDLTAVTEQLLVEGVKSFADSFEKLLADVEAKRKLVAAAA